MLLVNSNKAFKHVCESQSVSVCGWALFNVLTLVDPLQIQEETEMWKMRVKEVHHKHLPSTESVR